MSHPPRSRRTILPLALLLGGLLGTSPFVPRTLGAVAATNGPVPLDVPGLAGWLGVALAIAALSGVVLARRAQERERGAADATADRTDGGPGGDHRVDPLVAALKGSAAYAPDDLDARLTAGSTTAGPRPSAAPRWVRRMADEPPSPQEDWADPNDPDADEPLARLAVAAPEAARG